MKMNYGMDQDRKKAKESHCEIERRRRNKMSAYVNDLADSIPSCSSLPRKPDKLTTLRLAAAEMRKMRETNRNRRYDQFFLTDTELEHLILEAADGFLFAFCCDSGKVIQVSELVTAVINQDVSNWFGSSIFDHIHPDDVKRVQEQLSTQAAESNHWDLDLKTGRVKSHASMRLGTGSRRSFICRMRIGSVPPEQIGRLNRIHQGNTLGPSNWESSYAVVHCSGYIKECPTEGREGSQGGEEPDGTNHYLVAIGRVQVPSSPNTFDLSRSHLAQEFITRHSGDGTYTFVDQNVMHFLGYSPSELLGNSAFDFVHPEDCAKFKHSFERANQFIGQTVETVYRCRAKTGAWVWLQTSAVSFLTPKSEAPEFVFCTNVPATFVQNQTGDEGQGHAGAGNHTTLAGEEGISYYLRQDKLHQQMCLNLTQGTLAANFGSNYNEGQFISCPKDISSYQTSPNNIKLPEIQGNILSKNPCTSQRSTFGRAGNETKEQFINQILKDSEANGIDSGTDYILHPANYADKHSAQYNSTSQLGSPALNTLPQHNCDSTISYGRVQNQICNHNNDNSISAPPPWDISEAMRRDAMPNSVRDQLIPQVYTEVWKRKVRNRPPCHPNTEPYREELNMLNYPHAE